MSAWRSLLRPEVPLFFVAILRLTIGLELVSQGYDKLVQGYVRLDEQTPGRTNPLRYTLEMWIEEHRITYVGWGNRRTQRQVAMFPWYRAFLQTAVLPNTAIFAGLVTVAEIGLGLLLVLGLLVRVASVLSILLLLNYLFATWHLGFPYTTLNILFLVALVVLLVTGAGRALGVDAWLHEKFPDIPVF